MKQMKNGRVDTIVFFSGALPWVVQAMKESEKKGFKTVLFAARRHLEESVTSGKTFKDFLEGEGIRHFRVNDINDSRELHSVITEKSIGIGIGETYSFSQKTIDLFKGNIYDFMIIRLPQYRGGAHFTWQILRKSRVGCWNIQTVTKDMVPGLKDSGELIKTREYLLPQGAKIPADYMAAASDEALETYKEFLNEISTVADFHPIHIQENFSMYFPRVHTLHQGYINWIWNTDEIERFINAFDDPYPGASTFLGPKRLFLKDCRADYSDGIFHPFMSGLIYRIQNNAIYVAAKDGTLIIKKVQSERGEDIMSILEVGMRLYTPMRILEEAMLFNAKYDADGLVKDR